MGFLGFLKGGGGGLLSGIFGGGMGLIGQGINTRAQKQMQQEAFKYGREMMEKQNQAELQRMGLQFDYNKQTATYNQNLAREMYDYTFDKQNAYNNPAAEKARYEAAGLNPALLYGGGGGGGGGGTSATTSGGQMPAVTPMQPMGIQVALQAEAQKAQIELTKAQTNSIKADTMKKVTGDMANAGLDLIAKNLANKSTEKNNRKVEQEIKNLKTTNEEISANIEKIREEGKLAEFENWLNELKKGTAGLTDAGRVTFEDLYKEKVFREMDSDIFEQLLRGEKIGFERGKLLELIDNIKAIAKGEADGYRINTKKYEEMDWNLKNDKAFGDLLEELGTDSKYSKLLLGIIKNFFTKR